MTTQRDRLAGYRARLKEAGLSDEEIKRVIDPMESFLLQQEEVESRRLLALEKLTEQAQDLDMGY